MFILKILCILCTCICTFNAYGQDTTGTPFERITRQIKEYRIDTSQVPDDKTTRLIIKLRGLRGGFNINEAIAYKLEEDKSKKDITAAEYESIKDFFTIGNGMRLLNNAVIWTYRNNFSYKELKTIVRFYKTRAGQKLADVFPVIMLETLAAAQIIKEQAFPGKK